MIDRSHTVFDAEGEIILEEMLDVSWDYVKSIRTYWFEITDLWYLKDRWDDLSTTAKGELNTFRQTLRDLPQTYESANDAADNFPAPENWF